MHLKLSEVSVPYAFCVFVQAFSKKKVEERKEWLTNFMTNRRQRREHNLPEVTPPAVCQPNLMCFCFLLGFTEYLVSS